MTFHVDRKLTDVLSSGFTVSAEIIPTRNGVSQKIIFDQISLLVETGVEFLAVTQGAGGSLRGGSLPIAQMIKETFAKPCVAHFTCRDLTPVDIENHLMDHHYFGIRNILALRGDPPNGQLEWKAKEGCYPYAYQLIQQIQNLNRGHYLSRPNYSATPTEIEATDFCIGAAVYPDYPDLKEQIKFFQLKVNAGATFAMTDMLFDPESYAIFLDHCEQHKIHIPILPGTRLLHTQEQAQRIEKKFKVKIPSSTFNALPKSNDLEQPALAGIEIFLKHVDRLKALGAPGIHLYVVLDIQGVSIALQQLASVLKKHILSS